MAGVIETPLNPRQTNEMLEFLRVSENAASEKFDPIIATIGSGSVWIYRPVGGPKSGDLFEFCRNDQLASDVPKYYEVEIIKQEPVSSIPYILASMKANQAFSRNTFREIRAGAEDDQVSYRGNIAAIQSLIGWERGFHVDRLECVSSVEFETLVAKLFESHGFFVPAHRGGTLSNVDLFAYPENSSKNDLINIGSQQAISIQLKMAVRSRAFRIQLGNWLRASTENLLITLEDRPSPELIEFSRQGRYLTREWIRSAIARAPEVERWLSRSLNWLPPQVLK